MTFEKVRARLKAATPGPWDEVSHHTGPGMGIGRKDKPCWLWSDATEADDKFIAHARTDIPALLARIDELTIERDGYKDAYGTEMNDALEAALDRIDELTADNNALKTRVELAIGRIERHEPGAALTGLMAARGDFDE